MPKPIICLGSTQLHIVKEEPYQENPGAMLKDPESTKDVAQLYRTTLTKGRCMDKLSLLSSFAGAELRV